MTRKPIDLTLAGGKTPRQRIWEKIRALRIFNLKNLRGALPGGIYPQTVRSYVEALEKAGHVRHAADHPLTGKVYELVRDVGVEAPRINRDGEAVTQGQMREQLWRTIKILREFNAADAALAASLPELEVPARLANDYLRFLHRAGYLALASKSRPGTLARYRFIASKNSGPQPPMVQRGGRQVFDPNRGAVVWRRAEKGIAHQGAVKRGADDGQPPECLDGRQGGCQ